MHWKRWISIRNGNYDAVVSDYEMPLMNGILFLKTLRDAGNPIPFIIFTGKGREEIVIGAFNSGADSYIQKGGNPKIQFAELGHKIKKAVDRRRADRALEQSNAALRAILEATADGILVIDRDNAVTTFNRRFIAMWRIPDDVAGERDSESIFRIMDDQVTVPLGICTDPSALKNLAEGDRRDIITLNDGRVYRQYTSQPQMIGGEIAGSVWSSATLRTASWANPKQRWSLNQLSATRGKLKKNENPGAGHGAFGKTGEGYRSLTPRGLNGTGTDVGGKIEGTGEYPVQPGVWRSLGEIHVTEKSLQDSEDKYRNVFRAENSPLLLTDLSPSL